MFLYWFSAVLVVGSTTAYHICQKSVPPDANPLVSVFVTFSTAAVASLLFSRFVSHNASFTVELSRLNWASVAIGLTIVGVDVGYLLLYRSGWNVSLGSVFCNAWVAMLLIPVGVVVFKEKLVFSNLVGVVLAMAGLYLITRR